MSAGQTVGEAEGVTRDGNDDGPGGDELRGVIGDRKK